jgi:TetR/AcrR family transcriptional regulator, fatty acid metabolism regulator protein
MPNESIDTRTKILEAAVQVFAQKGYHETRVDDIVAESKTSKGSVYFYFPSKQDIFLGLIDTFSGLLENRLNEAIQKEVHGVQQMDTALHICLKLFSQYRTLAKIALVQAVGLGVVFEERRRDLNQRFAHIIQTRLDQAVSDGSIPPIQTELAARIWVGALNEIVVHWIYTGEPDLESAIPEIKAFLLRSIGAGESSKQ